MNREIRDKWIADLRTPGLKQAKGALRKGDGYCCLGRLCIVLGIPDEYPDRSTGVFGGLSDALGNNTAGKLELPRDAQIELMVMNDSGKTFPKIADWVEENL